MEKTNCKACSGSWKHNRMISAGWRLSILGFLRREASRCRLGSAAARRGSSRRQPLALTSSARAGGRAASSVAGQPRAGPLGRNGGPANAEAPGCCAPRSSQNTRSRTLERVKMCSPGAERWLPCVGLSSEDGDLWSYEGDGPEHWSGKCKDGKHQSPIDLGSGGTVTDIPHNIMLTGGGLNRVYSLAQIHFHWKSEHTINGKRYPLEVHFVHFEKRFKKVEDAVKVKGGIAVIGVMFEDKDSRNEIQVLDQVKDLRYDMKKNIKFSPASLLPHDTSKFYRYYGSLTTPGCDESVVWTVLSNSLPLSNKQISLFQKVTDSKGKFLLSNFRPLQKQNDRIVYFQSSPPHQVPYHSSALSLKNSLSIMSSLLIIFKGTIFFKWFEVTN
ncbi:Carbonic anhydrase 15 [Gryllus bimaculatus]|nr:Carbonic anhydrase 15 [Gryllus bimaculatus]